MARSSFVFTATAVSRVRPREPFYASGQRRHHRDVLSQGNHRSPCQPSPNSLPSPAQSLAATSSKMT
jgi:hypothetical protein